MATHSIPADLTALERAAKDVRPHAHAPYSRFHVGAAIACADGTVVTGCNVENMSFGATVCAERNAIFAAVTQGLVSADKPIQAIAIVAEGKGPIYPCGMCRQVIAEFIGEQPPTVVCVGLDGDDVHRETLNFADLFPRSFRF